MNQDQISQLVGAVAGAVQQASAPASPGWKTSEFWLHLLSYVPMGLGIVLGASNPITLGVGALAVVGSSVYTAARSGAKASGVAVAAAAAPAIAAAISAAVAAPAPAAK